MNYFSVIIKQDRLIKNATFKLALGVLLNDNTPLIYVYQAAGKLHDYVLLDAREFNEYKVSHIANARHVGFKDFHPGKIADVEKNQAIIVYCTVGKRSENVTLMLLNNGYTNVRNLYGGIFEWVNQQHSVYNLENKLTHKVHAYNRFWGRWLHKGIRIYG